MRIKRGLRTGGSVVIACIILVLIIIVGGMIIKMILKFCKDHLGHPPPPPPDECEVVPQEGYEIPAIKVEYLKGPTNVIPPAPAGEWTPCDGFGAGLVLPQSALPNGARVWVQRSTNLVDWADLMEVFPDSNGVVSEWCDTTPPWPQAFYRLRASLTDQ